VLVMAGIIIIFFQMISSCQSWPVASYDTRGYDTPVHPGIVSPIDNHRAAA